MKIRMYFNWDNYYDWIIIPTIMIGWRNESWANKLSEIVTGFAIGILFLKVKAQIIITY